MATILNKYLDFHIWYRRRFDYVIICGNGNIEIITKLTLRLVAYCKAVYFQIRTQLFFRNRQCRKSALMHPPKLSIGEWNQRIAFETVFHRSVSNKGPFKDQADLSQSSAMLMLAGSSSESVWISLCDLCRRTSVLWLEISEYIFFPCNTIWVKWYTGYKPLDVALLHRIGPKKNLFPVTKLFFWKISYFL